MSDFIGGSPYSELRARAELELSFGSDYGCREPILERIRMDRLHRKMGNGELPTRNFQGEVSPVLDDDAVLSYPLEIPQAPSADERQRHVTELALLELEVIFANPYMQLSIW